MEFERAIFRVYERCIESISDVVDNRVTSKSCRIIEAVTLTLGTFLLFAVIFLHLSFVGDSRCLPQLLEAKNVSSIAPDQILRIRLSRHMRPGLPGPRPFNPSSVDDDIVSGQNARRRLLGAQDGTYYHWYDKDGRVFSNQFSLNRWSSETKANSSKMGPPILNSAFRNATYMAPGSDFDYQFTYSIGILAIPPNIRDKHGFQIINVTIPDSCFGSKFAQSILVLGGVDTAVMNMVANTVLKGGVLVSSTGDYYSWAKNDIFLPNFGGDWLALKIWILFLSAVSFFFLSTMTALLVRVLISSGVVLMFPIFWLLQFFGVQVISAQIIRLSYPWIGVPMEILRTRNQSSLPFLLAHVTRVVIYYVFYEACQFAFASWIYGDDRPGQRELWLFALIMLWEYYSMIYARSYLTIQIFPRTAFALFLVYHFYVFSQPLGFHLAALAVLFVYMFSLMIYCARKYELEAYFRGDITIDHPRVLYNTVSWSVWPGALAPDFTVFLPVTNRAVTVYENVVPNLVPAPAAPAAGLGATSDLGAGGGANTDTSTLPGDDRRDAATVNPLMLRDLESQNPGGRRTSSGATAAGHMEGETGAGGGGLLRMLLGRAPSSSIIRRGPGSNYRYDRFMNPSPQHVGVGDTESDSQRTVGPSVEEGRR